LFVKRHPDLDWKKLADRARSHRVLAALSFACETLRSRLGVEVPIRLQGTRSGRLRRRIANFLLVTNASQPDPSRGALVSKIAFTAVLCDRPGAAIEFLQRQLLLIARRRARRHFPWLVPEEWSY